MRASRLHLDRDAVRQAVAIPLAVAMAAMALPYWPLSQGRWLMLSALLLSQVGAREPLGKRLRLLGIAAISSACLAAPFTQLGPHPVLFALGLTVLAFAANLLNASGKFDPRTTFFVVLLAMLAGGLAGSPALLTGGPAQPSAISAGLVVDLPAALVAGGVLAGLAAVLTSVVLPPKDPKTYVGNLLNLLAGGFEPVAAMLAEAASPARRLVHNEERLLQDMEQARDGLLLQANQAAVTLLIPGEGHGAPDASFNVRFVRLSRLVAVCLDDMAGVEDRRALVRLAPNLPVLASALLASMRTLAASLEERPDGPAPALSIAPGPSMLTAPSILARGLPFSQAITAYDLTANLEEMAVELTKLRSGLARAQA